jgi:hypothetical protein
MNANLNDTLQEFHGVARDSLEHRERHRYLPTLKRRSIVEQYRQGKLALVLDFMCRGNIDSIRGRGRDVPCIASDFTAGPCWNATRISAWRRSAMDSLMLNRRALVSESQPYSEAAAGSSEFSTTTAEGLIQ